MNTSEALKKIMSGVMPKNVNSKKSKQENLIKRLYKSIMTVGRRLNMFANVIIPTLSLEKRNETYSNPINLADAIMHER